MMNSLLLVFSLLLPSYCIKYEKGNFNVQTPGKTYRVASFEQKANELPLLLYDQKPIKLLWDGKVLILEKGSVKRVFSFQNAWTSKDLFRKEEITQNIQKINRNQVKKAPEKLLGHAVLQDQFYLLFSWHDSKNKPCFDALIELDLSAKRPFPKFKGILPGIDLDLKKEGSMFYAMDKELFMIRGFKEDWGIFLWEPSKKTPESKDFQKLGTHLHEISYLPNERQFITIEKTDYGTNLIALTSFSCQPKKYLAESRGNAEILSVNPLIAKLDQNGKQSLRTIHTGADLALTPEMKIKVLSNELILIWPEEKEPTFATLYDPKNWKVLSSWKRS